MHHFPLRRLADQETHRASVPTIAILANALSVSREVLIWEMTPSRQIWPRRPELADWDRETPKVPATHIGARAGASHNSRRQRPPDSRLIALFATRGLWAIWLPAAPGVS
jgi:hypothetical protein